MTLALTVVFTAGAGGVRYLPTAVSRASERAVAVLAARASQPNAVVASPQAPGAGVAGGVRSGVSGGVKGGIAGGVPGDVDVDVFDDGIPPVPPAPRTVRTVRTSRTVRTVRTSRTVRTLRTSRTLRTLRTLRAPRAARADGVCARRRRNADELERRLVADERAGPRHNRLLRRPGRRAERVGRRTASDPRLERPHPAHRGAARRGWQGYPQVLRLAGSSGPGQRRRSICSPRAAPARAPFGTWRRRA